MCPLRATDTVWLALVLLFVVAALPRCDLLFNRLPPVRAPGGDGDVGDAGDVGVSALRQQELLLRILNEPVYQGLKWFFAPGDTETDFRAEGANWNEGNTRRR